MSFLLHAFGWLGDLVGAECTGCGHETKYHHAIAYGSWHCDKCGGAHHIQK